MLKTDWLHDLRKEIADNPRKTLYDRRREYNKQKKEEEKLEWERTKVLLEPVARQFIEDNLIPLFQEMARKGCRGKYATLYIFENIGKSGISFPASQFLKWYDYLAYMHHFSFETILVAKDLASEYGIEVKGTNKKIIFRIKYC